MTFGLTLDTSALIALERGEKRMRSVFLAATAESKIITVPAAVLAEWWRGSTVRRLKILAAIDVEPTGETLAKHAGEASVAIKDATAMDAIVMASAAQRGDVVYTSDLEDLERLQNHFRSVRKVLRV